MLFHKISHYIACFVSLLFLSGCGNIDAKKPTEHLARVNDVYLNKAEVMQTLPDDVSPKDSIVFVHNYIKRWATKQLLLDGAHRNLSQETQEEFDAMVKNYRQELYTEAYKDMIIADKMDTAITKDALANYYKNNSTQFKLHENLVQLRYIKIARDYEDIQKIKTQFKRFSPQDEKALHEESIKFKAYSLNDSVWVRARELYKKIPLLKHKKSDSYLKKSNYIELNDSLSLYLIFIKNVRLRNEQAPLSYIKPTLKEIILNKRKLQFEKEFEKEITQDALEDNRFEIYN